MKIKNENLEQADDKIRRITFSLESNQYELFKRRCEQEGRKMSWLAPRIFKAGMDAQETSNDCI